MARRNVSARTKSVVWEEFQASSGYLPISGLDYREVVTPVRERRWWAVVIPLFLLDQHILNTI
jgi:hypothetical protein